MIKFLIQIALLILSVWYSYKGYVTESVMFSCTYVITLFLERIKIEK